MEKKIHVKRMAPKSEHDYSQQAQVIEKDPEPKFDHTKFALSRMIEIADRYKRLIEDIQIAQGKIADLNRENENMVDFIKFNVELEDDDEDDE